ERPRASDPAQRESEPKVPTRASLFALHSHSHNKNAGRSPRFSPNPKIYFAAAGSTSTNLPVRPLSTNFTTPLILANKVSSLPRPTLRPGLMRVPRCRTMIEPPGTVCPPKTFTPSRCEFESRPFRELPSPFLCAIDHLQSFR